MCICAWSAKLFWCREVVRWHDATVSDMREHSTALSRQPCWTRRSSHLNEGKAVNASASNKPALQQEDAKQPQVPVHLLTGMLSILEAKVIRADWRSIVVLASPARMR